MKYEYMHYHTTHYYCLHQKKDTKSFSLYHDNAHGMDIENQWGE